MGILSKFSLGALFLGLTISNLSFAREGVGHGGGGDPLVIDFMEKADVVEAVLEKNAPAGLAITSEQVRAKLKTISESLEGHSPALIFEEGETLQCFGATKLGCFENGVIRFARAGWQASSDKEKIELAAMELLLSLGQTGRYEFAAQIADAAIYVGNYTTEALRKYRLCLQAKPRGSMSAPAYEAVMSYLLYLEQRKTADEFLAVYQKAISEPAKLTGMDELALFEGGEATYCEKNGAIWYGIDNASMDFLKPWAASGSEDAIKVVLFYSALYPTDAADAEALAEVQFEMKRYQKKTINKVIKENAAFFKKHPIRWVPMG